MVMVMVRRRRRRTRTRQTLVLYLLSNLSVDQILTPAKPAFAPTLVIYSIVINSREIFRLIFAIDIFPPIQNRLNPHIYEKSYSIDERWQWCNRGGSRKNLRKGGRVPLALFGPNAAESIQKWNSECI